MISFVFRFGGNVPGRNTQDTGGHAELLAAVRKALWTLGVFWMLSWPSHAATEANTASEAELDGLRGLGPATTRRILDERQKSPFRDWADLMQRVRGLAPKVAMQLSQAGLTVNGHSYASASLPSPAAAASPAPASSAPPSAAPR